MKNNTSSAPPKYRELLSLQQCDINTLMESNIELLLKTCFRYLVRALVSAIVHYTILAIEFPYCLS